MSFIDGEFNDKAITSSIEKEIYKAWGFKVKLKSNLDKDPDVDSPFDEVDVHKMVGFTAAKSATIEFPVLECSDRGVYWTEVFLNINFDRDQTWELILNIKFSVAGKVQSVKLTFG